MSEVPLEKDFYKEEGWVKNLVDYYGNNKKKLPAPLLEKPMKLLAASIKRSSAIYGNFPETVYKALGQCVNPVFDPDKYLNEVYEFLKNTGEAENRPLVIEYADNLLNIRKFFERNTEFYLKHFKEEIDQMPGNDTMEKLDKFSFEIQNITSIHVNQVRKMIHDRK